jgi:non-specific serine/threonine protein kinase
LQIRKLMQATPGSYDIPSEPGMSAEAASYAVLGIDIEAAGIAVAKQWGLDESVQQMIRRLPVQTAVRHADSDAEVLRALGSCANELVDALATPDKPLAGQLQKLVQRYGRILSLTQKDLQEAVQGAPSGGSTGPAAVSRTAGSPRPGQPAGTPVR